MTAKIYRAFSGFRNVMDGVTLEDPGYERRVWEHDFVLPEGYTLSEDEIYGDAILDPTGERCDMCLSNNSDRAKVLLISRARTVALRRAKEAEVVHTTLQDLRKQAGLTQKQLAELAGVNIRQIQRVELGEAEAGNLTAKNLIALADALGVDPHTLI